MSFPSTAILTDFTTEPDGGPPPTADYGSAILGGPFSSVDMIVDGGLCLSETAENNCDAPYTAQTFTLPCEVWAILGPADTFPAASVYICDGTADSVFAFTWMTGYFLLFDQTPSSIWTSTENEFTDLAEGDGLGMKANADGSLELWVTYDGVTWTRIHTETGLTIPNPATIGLGNLAAG